MFVKILKRLPVFAIFSGISFAVGMLLPTVYNCQYKGKITSYFEEMEALAAGGLLLSIIVSSLFVWFGRKDEEDTQKPIRKFQFSLRNIMVVTALIAAGFGIAPFLDQPFGEVEASAILVCVAALGIVVESFFGDWGVRSRVGSVVACLFLPFVWMVAYNEPFGHTSGLVEGLPVGPGLLFSLLIGRLFGTSTFDEMSGSAGVFVLIQLGIGVLMARRGGKLSIAYLVLILGTSTLGSMILHALYRM